MVKLTELVHCILASVQWYLGGICLDNEAVVDERLSRAECELFVRCYSRKGPELSSRYVIVVFHLVCVSTQSSNGPFKRWSATNVEVTKD